MASEEFWELTPCEFYALMDRHREATELQFISVQQRAQFSSLWVNCNPDIKPEYRKTKPDDFIPKLKSQTRAETPAPVEKPDGSYRLSLWAAYAKVTGTG